MSPPTTLLLEQLEDLAPGILMVIGGRDGEFGPRFPLALRRLRHERDYAAGQPSFVHAQIRMEGSLVRATAIGQGNELALDGHALDCRVESTFARLSLLLARAHGLDGDGWRLVASQRLRLEPHGTRSRSRPCWALRAPQGRYSEQTMWYWADTGAPAAGGEPIPGLALAPADSFGDAPADLLPAALAALVLHYAPAIAALGATS